MATQRCQNRSHQVALAVEQLGHVPGLQLARTGDQAAGLVAGQQNHLDGQIGRAPLDGGGPGACIAAFLILLDEDEAGGGFEGDQTGVWAVEVLVGDDSDVLLGHAFGEAGTFVLSEVGELLFEFLAEGVQSAVGGGDEVGEFADAQEFAQSAQTAGPFEVKDQEESDEDTPQEQFATRGLQDGGDLQFDVVGKVLPQPVAESGARDAELQGVLSLGVVGVSVEIIAHVGDVESSPGAAVWPLAIRVGSLRESHGSDPLWCVVLKTP